MEDRRSLSFGPCSPWCSGGTEKSATPRTAKHRLQLLRRDSDTPFPKSPNVSIVNKLRRNSVGGTPQDGKSVNASLMYSLRVQLHKNNLEKTPTSSTKRTPARFSSALTSSPMPLSQAGSNRKPTPMRMNWDGDYSSGSDEAETDGDWRSVDLNDSSDEYEEWTEKLENELSKVGHPTEEWDISEITGADVVGGNKHLSTDDWYNELDDLQEDGDDDWYNHEFNDCFCDSNHGFISSDEVETETEFFLSDNNDCDFDEDE